MLEALGLTEHAIELYRMLLDRPGVSAEDLSERLGLELVEIRTGLSELSSAGLIVSEPTRPNLYAAAPPRPALERLLARRMEDLDRARAEIRALAAAFPAVSLGPVIEIVRDQKTAEQTYIEMQRAAKREIRHFDKPPYLLPLAGQHEAELEVLRRHVSYRVLYGEESLELRDQPRRARSFMRAGQEGRLVPEVPFKAVIIDEETGAVFEGTDPNTLRMLVLGKSPLLVSLALVFETLWHQGIPLSSGNHVPESVEQDPPVDPELLALLAAGIKDEAIAKQLGISVRTVRRRVANLLNQLGAHSRFQAGILARTRGLL